MSVNPITGVDVVNDRFVVQRISDGVLTTFHAIWPRPDGGPRTTNPPTTRYYKRVMAEPIAHDHRFATVVTETIVNADPPAEFGHPDGIYLISSLPVRRSDAELKLQVDAEFQRQVRLTFPDSENPATIIEAAGVIARKQAGTPITEAQQALLDGFIGMEDVISYMRQRQVALYAAIDADEDYDLTIGWTEA